MEHSPIGTPVGIIQTFDPDTPAARIRVDVTSPGDFLLFVILSELGVPGEFEIPAG